jgi:formiminoglutamase
MEAYPNDPIGVINLDSHFDVRPLKEGKAHSGSPFRQMLINPHFHKNNSVFIEFGCKGANCSNEHYQFLKENGAEVYWLEKSIRMFETQPDSACLTQAGQMFSKIVDELSEKVEHVFVSFDADSINSKFMPGVSAPSVVGGLTSAEATESRRVVGRASKVRMVDCS